MNMKTHQKIINCIQMVAIAFFAGRFIYNLVRKFRGDIV